MGDTPISVVERILYPAAVQKDPIFGHYVVPTSTAIAVTTLAFKPDDNAFQVNGLRGINLPWRPVISWPYGNIQYKPGT